MPDLDVRAIRSEITKQKADWKPKQHAVARLTAQRRARRLGVQLDESRLAALKKVPDPDMVRLVADFRGLRAPDVGEEAAEPKGRGELEADAFEDALDTSVAAAVGRVLARRPATVDWRRRRGRKNVTPVKDQGFCGSCVSFGTTAILESMLLIEHHAEFDLSEAELLFCGGGDCNGWWPDSAITYLQNRGIAHEQCFKYRDRNMPCKTCIGRNREAIRIRRQRTIWGMEKRKAYIASVGPMMAVFEVYDDFYTYGSGVYSHVTGPFTGLHCVAVVGYDDGNRSWLCKNSWGAGWGEQGFFRIRYGQCEIDKGFPFWGIAGTRWFL